MDLDPVIFGRRDERLRGRAPLGPGLRLFVGALRVWSLLWWLTLCGACALADLYLLSHGHMREAAILTVVFSACFALGALFTSGAYRVPTLFAVSLARVGVLLGLLALFGPDF